jgi:ABC-type sugar transport system permease subunit
MLVYLFLQSSAFFVVLLYFASLVMLQFFAQPYLSKERFAIWKVCAANYYGFAPFMHLYLIGKLTVTRK